MHIVIIKALNYPINGDNYYVRTRIHNIIMKSTGNDTLSVFERLTLHLRGDYHDGIVTHGRSRKFRMHIKKIQRKPEVVVSVSLTEK